MDIQVLLYMVVSTKKRPPFSLYEGLQNRKLSCFIEGNNAESITNRLLNHAAQDQKGSIIAVLEFKLSYRGWSREAYMNATIDLQKLAASKTDLAYAVMLISYNAPSLRRWEIYWPKICEEVNKPDVGGVRSIYAIHRLSIQTKEPNTYLFGQWQSAKIEQLFSG